MQIEESAPSPLPFVLSLYSSLWAPLMVSLFSSLLAEGRNHSINLSIGLHFRPLFRSPLLSFDYVSRILFLAALWNRLLGRFRTFLSQTQFLLTGNYLIISVIDQYSLN